MPVVFGTHQQSACASTGGCTTASTNMFVLLVIDLCLSTNQVNYYKILNTKLNEKYIFTF